jgi:hypothetical protein
MNACDLEIREPHAEIWVSLTAALSWIEFQRSMELEELLEQIVGQYGLTASALRLRLQESWRKLADEASLGRIEVRGRIVGDRLERSLEVDDLRNNRFLAWVVQEGAGLDVRVERHDGTDDIYDGEWERLADSRGFDFHCVAVRRDELLRLWPVPLKSVRRRQGAMSEARRASEYLREQLHSLAPKSVTKRQMIERVTAGFRVSASQALQVWREVTLEHPAWTAPGRPRKSIQQKSNEIKIAKTISKE